MSLQRPTVILALLAPLASARERSRLRIINGCLKETLWVAHEAGQGIGPDEQNVRIEPGEAFDFQTPGGLSGTRYWPKMRCNPQGRGCDIGESGGPQEPCDALAVQAGCAPPVDTKFEATFGNEGEEDWVDISLVDGYTLPFKFEMKGNCSAGFGANDARQVVDCSELSVGDCPKDEDLGEGGRGSLEVVSPASGKVVGCYSPCSKLLLAQWGNAIALDASISNPYCCPTPPVKPDECRAGPVSNATFVRAIHRMCPGVYGYAYDDGMGLIQCPSDTHYEVTFYCPTDTTSHGDWESPFAGTSTAAPQPTTASTRQESTSTVAPTKPPSSGRREVESLTWVTVFALPDVEGSTMSVGGQLPTNEEDIREVCATHSLCVGFAFRPETSECYLKKLGTGFDPTTAFWDANKWAHEDWQFHYIRERAASRSIRWVSQPGRCVGNVRGELLVEECTAGASGQQFSFVAGAVHLAADLNLCLQVKDQEFRGWGGWGSLLLGECQRSHSAQIFEFPPSGRGPIRWAQDRSRCLAADNRRLRLGGRIGLSRCLEGEEAQDFSLNSRAAESVEVTERQGPGHSNSRSTTEVASTTTEATTTSKAKATETPTARVPGKQILSAAHPLQCLTAHLDNGGILSLEFCSGADNQQFNFEGTEGKIRLAKRPELCIDIFDAEPHVRVALCNGSSTELSFGDIAKGAGKIRWASSPMICIAISDYGSAEAGRIVKLDTCKNHSVGQDFASSSVWSLLRDRKPKTQEFTDGATEKHGDADAHPQHSRRLRVTNGCRREPIWISHEAKGVTRSGGKWGPKNVKLEPLESYDFSTVGGSPASFLWAKAGCDADGESCAVGDGEPCNLQGCTPGVDTKLEAVFGDREDDLVFMGLADGFTLPFRMEIKGSCRAGPTEFSERVLDCSRLSTDRCPIAEDLGFAGMRVDLRQWRKQEVVGCYSPCAQLARSKTQQSQHVADMYCCPSSSQSSCHAGSTEYVQVVHQMCEGVNGFALDEGLGIMKCRNHTQYELTFFCPAFGEQQHDQPSKFVKMLISKDSGPKDSEDSPSPWRHVRLYWRSCVGAVAGLAAAAMLAVAVRIVGTNSRTPVRNEWELLLQESREA